jgi:signal peptide peptidase-like protein 2B
MLLILYLFLDYLKDIFSILILVSCIGCASIIIEDFLIQGLNAKEDHFLNHKIQIPCCGNVSVGSILGTVIGVILSVSWYITHNWILNNTLALLLALTFLKSLRLTTLVPGLLLLGLLFFYDIFWVFITPYFTSSG